MTSTVTGHLRQYKDIILSNISFIKKYIAENKLKSFGIYIGGICVYMIAHNIFYRIKRIYYKIPPGPIGIPKFGVMFSVIKMGVTPYFNYCCSMYGPLTFLNFGSQKGLYLISNAELARKILKKKGTTSRPQKGVITGNIHIICTKDETYAFQFENGDEWLKRRQLFQSVFIRMCKSTYINKICKDSMNNVILPNALETIEKNEIFYPRKLFQYIALNTIYHVNFGRSLQFESQDFNNLSTTIDNIQSIVPKAFIFGTFGFLRKIPSMIKPFHDARDNLSDLIRKLMIQRQNEYDKHNPETYLDELLVAVNNNKYSMSQAEADISGNFRAGIGNTLSAMEHCIAFCTKYPLIVDKVRSELLTVHNIGNKTTKFREFDLTKINSLHLFRAFIHECLRLSSIAPSGFPRYLFEDIQVTMDDGTEYMLYKDNYLNLNILYMNTISSKESWNVHNLQSIYLQNWLDKNHKFKYNENFSTFGFGRRDCPGMTFAKKEIFIVLGYMIMNFNILSVDGKIGDEIVISHKHTAGVRVIHPEVGVKLQAIKM